MEKGKKKPYDNKRVLGRKGKFMYVPVAQRRICVEFRPVRQFAVSQDLGQPDSCEKADRRGWTVPFV